MYRQCLLDSCTHAYTRVHTPFVHPSPRRYHRASGVDFVAPLARFFPSFARAGVAGRYDFVDIWASPTHEDMPDVVPPGQIGIINSDYSFVSRPLDWVLPTRECLFDGKVGRHL